MYRHRLGFLRIITWSGKWENVRNLKIKKMEKEHPNKMADIKRKHCGKFKHLIEEVLEEPLVEFGALPLESEWLVTERSGGSHHYDEFMKHIIEEPFTEFGATGAPSHGSHTLTEIHRKHHEAEHILEEIIKEPFIEFGAPPQAYGGRGVLEEDYPGSWDLLNPPKVEEPEIFTKQPIDDVIHTPVVEEKIPEFLPPWLEKNPSDPVEGFLKEEERMMKGGMMVEEDVNSITYFININQFNTKDILVFRVGDEVWIERNKDDPYTTPTDLHAPKEEVRPEDLRKEVAGRVEDGMSKELLERFIFPVIPDEDRWDEGIWKNEDDVHHTEVWEDTLRFHLPPGAVVSSLETRIQDNMLRIKLQKTRPGEPTNSKSVIPKRFLM